MILLNESTETIAFVGYAPTCRTAEARPDHGYTLSSLVYVKQQGPGGWTCGPGMIVFVRSGVGQDQFFPKSDGASAQFHFYLGRDRFIWDTPANSSTCGTRMGSS